MNGSYPQQPPEAPGRPPLRHLRQLASRTVTEFFDDGCPQVAAGISYFTLFSLFPLAILAVAGFGLVVEREAARERIVEVVLREVPLTEDRGRAEFEQILEQVSATPGAFGVAGLLALIFSASGLMRSLRYGMNTAWDVEDVRPPVAGKLVDLLLVLATGIAVGASLALTVVIRVASQVLGEQLMWLTSVAGYLAPVGLSFAVFLFLYRILPATQTRLRDVWPGALVAALLYEAAKLGFSWYLSNFADYNAVYGSLGAAVAFLFFVFIAANVLLLGAEVASEWPRVRAGRYDAIEAATPDQPLTDQLRDVAKRLVVGGRDPASDADDRKLPEQKRSEAPPG